MSKSFNILRGRAGTLENFGNQIKYNALLLDKGKSR